MTRVQWNESGNRRFELGLDRGVLYPNNGPGVAWNGLTSVNVTQEGGNVQKAHADGIKYANFVGNTEFKADMSAFSVPVEFGPCVGEVSVRPGFILGRQPRQRFGLSYRTMDGLNDYKIHLIYDALATTKTRDYATIGADVTPSEHEWEISSVPKFVEGYKPSSHFVIESRKTPRGLLSHIESILYGTEEEEPRLPDIQEIRDLFEGPGPIVAINLAPNPKPIITGVSGNTSVWIRGQTAFATMSAVDGHGKQESFATNPTARVETVSGPELILPENTDFTFSAEVLSPTNAMHIRVGYTRPGAWEGFGSGDWSGHLAPSSSWQKHQVRARTPADVGSFRLLCWILTNAATGPADPGDWFEFRNLAVWLGHGDQPYFDGDTPDENGYFYEWEGTPNASASIARSWN